MSKLVQQMAAKEHAKELRRGKLRRKNATEEQKKRQRASEKKWRDSVEGKLWHKNKEQKSSTKKHRIKWRESNRNKLICNSWKAQGILGLTIELWNEDSKKGCLFAFLGNCRGKLFAHHNHETGQYIGPLCIVHNTSLARLGDSLDRVSEVHTILESRRRRSQLLLVNKLAA